MLTDLRVGEYPLAIAETSGAYTTRTGASPRLDRATAVLDLGGSRPTAQVIPL